MLSSICVATMTGLPASLHLRTMRFWMTSSSANGISTPRSPRATMMPSLAARISSKLSTPSCDSILEMTSGRSTSTSSGGTPCAFARARRTSSQHRSRNATTERTSCALRTKLAAT